MDRQPIPIRVSSLLGFGRLAIGSSPKTRPTARIGGLEANRFQVNPIPNPARFGPNGLRVFLTTVLRLRARCDILDFSRIRFNSTRLDHSQGNPMDLPKLHGIIPPLATPLQVDGSLDEDALATLVEFQIKAGVHGLWVLGTTAKFDLLTDARQRRIAEIVAHVNDGRLPLVLNVSDMGTDRTKVRAAMFDDLPYDYYAALPPWYQPMSGREVTDYYTSIADSLSRPIVIYNAPWINNQLSFDCLRQLAQHPRIVGCKDVNPSLSRMLDWPVVERRSLDFSYLHGFDQLATSTVLGSDGFVSALANPLPELSVAIWDAALADDCQRAFRLQIQHTRLSQAMGFGPTLACLEVLCRHRGLLQRMLPPPLRSLEPEMARRIVDLADVVGVLPELETSTVGS
jgi:dihydrodipicolinate synthase/N-acetylneuraminate lyase